jgi:hypothetical protein
MKEKLTFVPSLVSKVEGKKCHIISKNHLMGKRKLKVEFTGHNPLDIR